MRKFFYTTIDQGENAYMNWVGGLHRTSKPASSGLQNVFSRAESDNLEV